MRFRVFLSTLLFFQLCVSAQEYVYTNTDNLVLRDRPEKIYRVLAVLHAPSRLSLEPYERGYKNDKGVTDRFYEVSFTYRDEKTKTSETYGGWVEKQYVVKSLKAVTFPGADTMKELAATAMVFSPYMGTYEHNPNKMNYREFPYPKYKGGEKHFDNPTAGKHAYHSGSRGGCYYINKKGKKQYVDSKYCK